MASGISGNAVVGAYFVLLGILSCYGLHRWYLIWTYHRHRNDGFEPRERFAFGAGASVDAGKWWAVGTKHRVAQILIQCEGREGERIARSDRFEIRGNAPNRK